jgi:hypothetical protein
MRHVSRSHRPKIPRSTWQLPAPCCRAPIWVIREAAATGYYWGEPKLRPLVERILEEAQEDGNERLEQLAQRFLRMRAWR